MTTGFDPKRSKVADSTIDNFLSTPLQADLITIPGIGPAAVRCLGTPCENDESPQDVITNTAQLFGKYLTLKGPDSEDYEVSVIEHNDRFWHFLKQKGIQAHRSAIVLAVAKKAVGVFPWLYDEAEYLTDSDGED